MIKIKYNSALLQITGYETPPTTKTGKPKMWVKMPKANPNLSGKKKKPQKPKDTDGTFVPLQSCQLFDNRVMNRADM